MNIAMKLTHWHGKCKLTKALNIYFNLALLRRKIVHYLGESRLCKNITKIV
uniref:Uncharacterized protein n=1 Tax=Arundo donax TaxID=35708 RepID=A0A0A8ZTH3_ARUDO